MNLRPSETETKQFEIGQTPSSTVKFPKNLEDQINDVIEAKTERDTYKLFYETQYSTSGSQVSTSEPDKNSEILNELKKVIDLDPDEISEDPEKFEFAIYKIIHNYDSLSLMILFSLIETESIDYLIAIRLLSFLGRITHPTTYHHRSLLLQNSLKNKSRYIREGARLGLLYLNNPAAIKSLNEAIKSEPSANLKNKLIFTVKALGS